MDNKNKHKDLNDLFKQRHSSAPDDFEKEALEGFDLLSEEEAFQLKNELDAEIGEKLFKPKKQTTRIYFLAAASFVLIVGLSVLFMINTNVLEEKAGIALNQDINEIAKPEGIISKDELGSTKEKMDAAPDSKSDKSIVEEEKVRRIQNKVSEQDPQKRSINAKETQNVQQGDGLAESPKEQIVGEVAASSEVDDLRLDKSKGKANDREQLPVEDKKSEEEKILEIPATKSSVTSAGKAESVNALYKEKARKKSRSSSNEPKPAQQNNADQDFNLAESRNEGKLKDEVATSPSAPSNEAVTTGKNAGPGNSTSYSYKSGEAELEKDLRAKLTKEEVNERFDAILFINKKGKVEKVNVFNTFSLSNKKINAIEKILKDLDHFNVPAKASGLYEYKLNYRP